MSPIGLQISLIADRAVDWVVAPCCEMSALPALPATLPSVDLTGAFLKCMARSKTSITLNRLRPQEFHSDSRPAYCYIPIFLNL